MKELTKSQVLENLKKGNYEIEAQFDGVECYYVLLTINNQEILSYNDLEYEKYYDCIDSQHCKTIFEIFGYKEDEDYNDNDEDNIIMLEKIDQELNIDFYEDYQKAKDKVKADSVINFMKGDNYLILETHTGFANLPGVNYFVKKENLESLKNQIEDKISDNFRKYGTSDFVIKGYSIYETPEELLNSIFHREPDTSFPNFYIYDGPNDIKSLEVDLYGTYVMEIEDENEKNI